MPGPVFVIRGGFEPNDLQPLLQSRAFQDDAHRILEMSDDDFSVATDILKGFKGTFLSRKQLEESLQDVLNTDTVRCIVAFSFNLTAVAERRELTVEDLIGSMRNLLKQPSLRWVEDIDTDLLLSRCTDLTKFDAIRRQIKAESLATETGTQLESLRVVADLRPIFDDERRSVAGLMPLTTLKLVVGGQDGLPNQIDLRLTGTQVDDLLAELEAVQRKLLALNELLDQKEISRPDPV